MIWNLEFAPYILELHGTNINFNISRVQNTLVFLSKKKRILLQGPPVLSFPHHLEKTARGK